MCKHELGELASPHTLTLLGWLKGSMATPGLLLVPFEARSQGAGNYHPREQLSANDTKNDTIT